MLDDVKRSIRLIALLTVLLACTTLVQASVASSLTATITMDCSVYSAAYCSFNPGYQGSPEYGSADFNPVAPGWSASFYSAPAIAWVFDGTAYYSEFGPGGSFEIAAPGGLQLSGTLTSGLSISFLDGYAETVAWFGGYWNNGLYAEGTLFWNNFDYAGSSATLDVTTFTPEPSTFILFGSGVAGLAGLFRRTLY